MVEKANPEEIPEKAKDNLRRRLKKALSFFDPKNLIKKLKNKKTKASQAKDISSPEKKPTEEAVAVPEKEKNLLKSFKSSFAVWLKDFRALKNLQAFGRGLIDVERIKTAGNLAKELKAKKAGLAAEAQKEVEKKSAELDAEIAGVENANKLKVRRLKKIHYKLLESSSLYRKWNSNPNVAFHNIALASVFILSITVTSLLLYHPMLKRALADANTCTWTGATSTDWGTASNWANSNYCDGSTKIPGPNQNITFSATAANDLILVQNRTVTAISNPAGGMTNHTFNTNGYSLTVNGDLTWQAGTFNASASEITISGSLDVSAGTFTQGSSNIIMAGSGSSSISPASSGNTTFYDLTIQNAANTQATTLQNYNISVSDKLNIIKGKLDGSGRTVTLPDGSPRYYIGDSSGTAGSATIAFAGTGYVDAAGGVANNIINANGGSGKTVYWNGSATVTFVNQTAASGTLNIQSGKLSFPASTNGSNGELSCVGSSTLTFGGTAVGRMVILRSQTASAMYFANNCSATGDYVDAQYVNATSAITFAHGINAGNNNNVTVTNEIANLNRWTDGAADNSWGTDGNWALGHKPTASEVAYFTSASSNANVSLTADASITGIISDDYTGTLDTTSANSYNLTVAGLTWNSGTLSANGSVITNSGSGNLSAGTFTSTSSKLKFTTYGSKFIPGLSTYYDFEIDAGNAGQGGIEVFGIQTVSHYLLLTNGDLSTGEVDVADNVTVGGNSSGSGLVKMNGSGTKTLTGSGSSGTGPRYQIASTGTVNLSGNIRTTDWRFKSGTFNPGTGKVTFTQYGSSLKTDGVNSFYDLESDSGNTGQGGLTVYGTQLVSHNYISTNGDLNNGTIKLSGTGSDCGLVIPSTSDGGGSATVLFAGASGDQVITETAGGVSPPIAVNKAAGSVKLASDVTVAGVNQIAGYTGTLDTDAAHSYALTVNGAFNWKSGTLIANNSTITAAGSSTDFNGGTFTKGTSNLTFTANEASWTPGSSALNDVTFNTAGGSGHGIAITGTANVNGNLLLTKGTVNSGTVSLTGNLTLTTSGNVGAGAGTIDFTGTSTSTIYSSGGVTPTISLSKTGGGGVILNDDLNCGRDWTYNSGSFSMVGKTLTFSTNERTWTPGNGIIYNNININLAPNHYLSMGGANPANINGNLTLTAGTLWTGSVNLAGDFAIGANTGSGIGTSAVSLTGAGVQTITTSTGLIPGPILTINKPSGKAVVTTSSGSGTFFGSIQLTSGTLEFSGANNDQYTFYSGTKITTNSGTILRYSGVDDTHRVRVAVAGGGSTYCASGYACIEDSGQVYANWVTVDHSIATNMIYAMNTPAGNVTNSTNWDTTSTSYTWSGGASGNWGTTTNWTPNGTPDANDSVTIDTASAVVSTAGNISFGSLTVGGTNGGTLKISGTNDQVTGGDLTIAANGTVEQDNNVAQYITDNLDISGTLTSGTNSTTTAYRVFMSVGNNFTVENGATINVNEKGFAGGSGPGVGGGTWGSGGYGGAGGIYNSSGPGGPTYGSSYSAPTELGSGAASAAAGGGSVQVSVGNTAAINGSISANGQSSTYRGGSGGSIYLKAGAMSGTGAVTANGGNGGGGGRISISIGTTDFGSVYTNATAYGGTGIYSQTNGGAGTIFSQMSGQSTGSLKVDNNSQAVYNSAGTPIPSTQSTWPAFDSLTVDHAGDLQVLSGTTLTLTNSELSSGSGTIAGFITHRGGTLNVPASFEISKATINEDSVSPFSATTISGMTNLDIKSGGNLSHSYNPAGSSATYKLNLNIPGTLNVESGGSVDVTGRGYTARSNSGQGSGYQGGAYGGQGLTNAGSTPDSTYGSAIAPTDLGGGGASGSGGGAIQLNVTGATTIGGTIKSVGEDNDHAGAGGSIYISTSGISGAGSLNANGGAPTAYNGGGGGRIAVVLTGAGNDFSSAPSMTAYGGAAGASAGTIYTKTTSQTNGKILVGNNGMASVYYATLFGDGSNCTGSCITASQTLDSLVLQNAGRLALVDQQTLTYGSDLTIPSGTTLAFMGDTSTANGSYPTLNETGTLTVNGTISADGLGHTVGDAGSGGNGAGGGTTNGGGGGFGGAGGLGASESSGAGGTYGSTTNVAYLGSAGGKTGAGAGGGHIEINVTGDVNIGTSTTTGTVSANGSAGSGVGGGGSGGAIRIYNTGNLDVGGNGVVTANGGAGGTTGGGGGGGRIYFTSRGGITNTGTITTSFGFGNGGGANGSAGSINLQSYAAIPTLLTPSNTATNQSQTLNMTFTTTDANNDWVRYRVQLATDSGFSQNLSTFTETSGSQTVTDGGRTAIFKAGDCSSIPPNGSPAGTGYNSGANACLSIDPSTPLVQGQTYYWKVAAIDPGGTNDWTYYSSSQSYSVSSIDKTVFTTGTTQTIRAATDTTCSAVFTFEIRNTLNEKVKLLNSTNFTLGDGSHGGVFYYGPGCSNIINANTLTLSAGNDTGAFYYSNTHSNATAYNITVSETPSQGWSDATTTIQVNPGNLSYFTVTGFPTEIDTDSFFSSPIVVTAYDIQGNVKFDYYNVASPPKVWFTTTSSNYDLPYTSYSQSYAFTQADAGQHSFPGSCSSPCTGFRLKTTGTKTITFHHNAWDGNNQDSLSVTSAGILVDPGATTNFLVQDIPLSAAPYNTYVLSGNTWDQGILNGAAHQFTVKVTARDQWNNTATNYRGQVWFEAYTGSGDPADCAVPYSQTNPYPFSAGDSGIHTFGSAVPSPFSCNSAGNNIKFRVTDGSVTKDNTIYIKPLGLSSFLLETTPTLSRSGTNWDKAIDTPWSEQVSVTAYDANGQVKVDYQYDPNNPPTDGSGEIYFSSPERPAYDSSGNPYQNQEFSYYKTSTSDMSHCTPFYNPNYDGTTTYYNGDSYGSSFEFLKGGQRTMEVSECIDPTSDYAQTHQLYDPNFENPAPQDRPNPVASGWLPLQGATPPTVAVATHVPGTNDTYDSHPGGADNFLASPEDMKIKLSWLNPFDTPMTSGANSQIYIYQCTGDSSACASDNDFSLLSSPRPLVTGTPSSANDWQDQEISNLTNNQAYSFRLKLGYKRSDGTYIISDFSQTATQIPRAIAPIITNQTQLDRTDPTYPGQVKIDYELKFTSDVTFSYLINPATNTWGDVSDSAVSGDKGTLTVDGVDGNGNPYSSDNPKPFTTYIDMNTNFDGQITNGFKIRINVYVPEQDSSGYSDSNALRLDTKNPTTTATSLVINATSGSTANLSISATDDSPPMQMKICNDDPNTNGDPNGPACTFETYATSKTNWSIADPGANYYVKRIYITFRDMYYNDTVFYKDITGAPENFQVKDASNISSQKFRLVLIWDDVTGTVHYNVWRTTDGTNYSQFDTATKNGYLDINLDSNTDYGYYVTAQDSLGNISLPTPVVSARPGSAPAVNQDPQVTLYGWKQDSGVRAEITWNTDQASTSYVAYSTGPMVRNGDNLSTTDGSTVQFAGTADMITAHDLTISNLQPQTTYYFCAFSANEIQIKGYSKILSFTTPIRIPLLISGMQISDVTMTGALVNWSTTKPATTVLEYGPSTAYGQKIVDSNYNVDHSFKLSNLASGVTYNLRASVTDSDGNTTVSDNYIFSTPAMPVVLSVSVGTVTEDTATINWTTNVNTDSNVVFSTTGTTGGTQGNNDSTTIHAVTLIGLEPKTTYSFYALSKDQFGNAAKGSQQTFTTASDTTPPVISNIQSEVTSTGTGSNIQYQAVISWDTDEPATSQIDYAPGITGDYSESTREDLSLNSTHVVIIQNLKPNSAYHFRIKSQDKAGNLRVSDDNSIITPPQEQSLLSVVLKSLQDTFSWVGRLQSKWFSGGK